MHRGSGTIIILGVSVFYAVASFYRLWARGRYLHFFKLLGGFVGWGGLLALGFWYAMGIPNADQRVWAVIPVVIQVPILMLSGFLLRSYVEHVLDPARYLPRRPADPRIRLLGAVLSAIAFSLWLYGVLHPMTGSNSGIILAVMCYSAIFGVPYLIAGRRINDLN
jgi:hypothetical protein